MYDLPALGKRLEGLRADAGEEEGPVVVIVHGSYVLHDEACRRMAWLKVSQSLSGLPPVPSGCLCSFRHGGQEILSGCRGR